MIGNCFPMEKTTKKNWVGFLKSHKHMLHTNKGNKFPMVRSEWCLYRNFEKMYNLLYEMMEESSVIKELSVP